MLSIQEKIQITTILYPDTIAASREYGGKAGALASLHTTNLPIPQWFVVSPAAFHASLSEKQRRAFEVACAEADLPAIAALLANVQLDIQVRKEIERAVDTLCPAGEYLAVRSSALDEDGAARSFAGQLESFLFVAPEQVAEKIVEVWRSGFSKRVLTYRREHGLSIVAQPPAVLVQRMVEAEVEGVAFSANPVTGQRGVALVSALYGLGTALVSGECDADTWTLDRQNAFLSRTIAEKKIAERHICGNVVEQVPVSPALATQPALTDEQIRAVADLARRCERHFGCPQDIEWALADGELFLLQARPITSLAQMPDPDGAYALWDNSNIAESYNGVTTPLTFSFARSAYEQVYRQMCRVLGVSETVIQSYDDTFRHMIGLINGRVYYNLLSWYRLLALMPGFKANRRFMEGMMGVKEGLPESIVAELGQLTWGGRMQDRLRLVKTLGTLLASYHHLPRDIQRFFQRIDQALNAEDLELDAMRPDELVAVYRSLERQLITHWDAPLVNDLFAMLFYGILRTLAVKWCGDESGSLQNDLLTGEGGIISAEPATRVREMATLAAPHPTLVASLCSGSMIEIQREIDAYPTFAGQYQSYLDRFADRCLEELKLESATLRDDPLPLLRSIGHLARRLQTGGVEQMAHHAPAIPQGAREGAPCSPLHPLSSKPNPLRSQKSPSPRQQAEQRVSLALRGHPIHRMLFGWVLKQARARVRDRENLRFERTRVFGHVRRIFVELGKRLYVLDRLEEPRDIFYLEVEEALGFVTGTATTTDLKGLVSTRKAEYARFKTLAAPADRFETYGIVNASQSFASNIHSARSAQSLVDDAHSTESGQSEARTGIGCCPGIVRGLVRIVTDPHSAEIHTGEILVAQRTDPGWIMLFPAAAGVLVERGSLLSHSAIVAREMGIPTIVALNDATRWLRTGDWVEMDGSSGGVRKLNEPAKKVAHG